MRGRWYLWSCSEFQKAYAVYKLLNKNTRERLKVEEDILISPHELDKRHRQILEYHPDCSNLHHCNSSGLFYVSQGREIQVRVYQEQALDA